VLPIVIDSCELPSPLSNKVYADFTEAADYYAALSRLLRPLGVTRTAEELETDLAPSWLQRAARGVTAPTLASVAIAVAGAFFSAVGMKVFAKMPVAITGPADGAVFLFLSSLGPGLGFVVLLMVMLFREAEAGTTDQGSMFTCGVIMFGLFAAVLGFVAGLPFFLFDFTLTLDVRTQLVVAAVFGGVVSGVGGWVVIKNWQ
jgi:hypothetical protein